MSSPSRSARRVALGATALLLAVYVLAAAVADLVVLDHLEGNLDARLSVRLTELVAFVGHGKLGRAATGPAATDPAATDPAASDPAASDQAASAATGTATAETSTVRTRPAGTGPSPPASTGAEVGAPFDPDDAPVFGWWVPSGSSAAGRGSAGIVALQAGAPALPRALAAHSGLVDATLAGLPFRLESAAAPGGRVVVGTSLAQITTVRSTLIVIEGVLLPFVLLTFFVVAYAIGRRSALPVERARLAQIEFTADASHELRTPLSVIEAEAGLALSADRAAASYRAALERVAGESRRLRSIVDDLLWLARLDARPASSRNEVVDLAQVAESVVARFDSLARQRGLRLYAAAEPGVAAVQAPTELIERLASVLVDNASRYCPAGGAIEVAAALVDGRPTITVDDSGPGVPAAERERIFDRFHRGRSSPEGAGLGLAIAERIVATTGGAWHLSTSPAGGARFRVSWPRVAHPARAGSTALARPPAPDDGAAYVSLPPADVPDEDGSGAG